MVVCLCCVKGNCKQQPHDVHKNGTIHVICLRMIKAFIDLQEEAGGIIKGSEVRISYLSHCLNMTAYLGNEVPLLAMAINGRSSSSWHRPILLVDQRSVLIVKVEKDLIWNSEKLAGFSI